MTGRHAGDDDVSLDAAIGILTDGKTAGESAEKKSVKLLRETPEYERASRGPHLG